MIVERALPFDHQLSCTIIDYHQLSFSLSLFKIFMIVDDSFSRLTTRMIVHDSFSVSCFPRKSAGSFKMAAKSCSRVSRGSSENSVDIEDDNPDIIEKVHVIDETLEELEEPPSKKNRVTKLSSARWSNDLIFRLIDEYEARPCLWDIFSKDYHNRDITGKVKQEMEVRLLSQITICFSHVFCENCSTMHNP